MTASSHDLAVAGHAPAFRDPNHGDPSRNAADEAAAASPTVRPPVANVTAASPSAEAAGRRDGVVGRPLAAGLPAVRVAVEPIEKYREFLQTKGLRLTRERSIIVDEVFANHEHFDAEQLIQRLASRQDGKRVSRSTIYRTLTLLEEAGLLRKVARQEDRDVFEHAYGYPHHDHLICGRCGTLIEFHDPRLRAILEEVARERQFRLTTHRLEVDGLCGECSGPPASRPAKLNLM